MSNYTYVSGFGAKDALNTGDPNKVIKGSDFETEFTAISTAVNSKANTASPTFTGTVTIGGVTYPTSDGSSGQVLSTDGAGNLSFTSSSGFDSTTNEIALGSAALASGSFSVSIGTDSDSTKLYSVALGHNAQATGQTGDIAIGKNATTVGSLASALAVGYSSAASGAYSTAVGYNATAATYATAVNQATASGARSVAIGHSAAASANDSVSIGYDSAARGPDSIAIGNLSGANTNNTIHINARGVNTNQPQTAGHIVIESSTAKLAYDGNWDLSTGDLTVNGGVEIGTNWKVRDNGSGVLIFSTGGVDKMKLDASGNLTVVGNVTAFGTI